MGLQIPIYSCEYSKIYVNINAHEIPVHKPKARNPVNIHPNTLPTMGECPGRTLVNSCPSTLTLIFI
jgi:hypothetical protein